jgi:hypothetical protein
MVKWIIAFAWLGLAASVLVTAGRSLQQLIDGTRPPTMIWQRAILMALLRWSLRRKMPTIGEGQTRVDLRLSEAVQQRVLKKRHEPDHRE